jgi:putative hydrolase of the HAD superfamily
LNNNCINPVRSKSPEATATPLVRTSNGVKAIIFDLGNVLIDFDHIIAAKRISRFCKKSPEEIFELFFDSELTSLFEEGKISAKDFFLKVKEVLNLKIEYDEFVPIWNDIFFLTEKNKAACALAGELKKYYKLIVLSNINILHFEYIKKTFPILNTFRIITSYELGFRKPQNQIYQKVLEILNTPAYECFYTDDRTELVESAKKLGIQAFVFKDIEQLKKDLLYTGININ